MKTALLLFCIWLIGFLISLAIYLRAMRYKTTATLFDYVLALCCACLSWLALVFLLVCYCRNGVKKWKTTLLSWWNRLLS